MAWITLTETDLLSRLSDPEVAAFKDAAVRGSEGDATVILGQVTDLVRGYVGVEYTLGASGTIPQKLKGPALDIAVIDIMKRAGGTIIDPGGERKAAKDDALHLLEQVAAGKFAIEEPTVEDTEEIGNPKPSFSGKDASFGKEFEDGL